MVTGSGERCPACAFAPDDWDRQDAQRTFANLALWWEAIHGSAAPEARASEWASAADALDGALTERLLTALHHGLHDISAAARDRAVVGEGAAHQRGTVVAVSAGSGGVPKRPVLQAEVGWRGVVGDRQAARRHHGRPWQALCLWSADVIDRLRAEGHPIAPGAAGENLTVAGIDWSTVKPGTRVEAGGVLAEISLWAIPCSKNAQWFADGDFNRMSHEREPGISRMYATVLRPGPVAAGDPFVVEPD